MSTEIGELASLKNLKIDPALHRRLKVEAAARGVSLQTLTEAALAVGLAAPELGQTLVKALEATDFAATGTDDVCCRCADGWTQAAPVSENVAQVVAERVIGNLDDEQARQALEVLNGTSRLDD